MNTKILPIIAIAASMSAPLFAHAQSNVPATRASVRAELIQLENAGYRPETDRLNYPVNLQNAERRLQNTQAQSSGSSTSGSTASGVRQSDKSGDWNPNPVDYSHS
ncbi:hypothetical protein WM40_23375 [Robbsia andropogonis]|uniref:DUF4148 domain-containing protein n=1 Tax=Robbsia andropogonis TaxID=28092 RepID=A0A0F5JU89_9BURK|nr:DUF4148 domain-containing protein [Robbsia andropogonis]KKB61411.1 hypothetical protein WM40_23375 [Robbsia andropogonis]MCP1119509.1 DUF4148 domain-containing protein [Robbsia andropogonis]MCP1129492.1 DUF4148 domain-containing protein [Robbsia andropogonis]